MAAVVQQTKVSDILESFWQFSKHHGASGSSGGRVGLDVKEAGRMHSACACWLEFAARNGATSSTEQKCARCTRTRGTELTMISLIPRIKYIYVCVKLA